jgi:hypothetical protein
MRWYVASYCCNNCSWNSLFTCFLSHQVSIFTHTHSVHSTAFFYALPIVHDTSSKNAQVSPATTSFPWRHTNTSQNHGYNAVADDSRRQPFRAEDSALAPGEGQKGTKDQTFSDHIYPTVSSRTRGRFVQSLVQIGSEMWICIRYKQTFIFICTITERIRGQIISVRLSYIHWNDERHRVRLSEWTFRLRNCFTNSDNEFWVSGKMITGTQAPFCKVTLILASILKTGISGTCDIYLSRISSLLCPNTGAKTFYVASPNICQITECHIPALYTLNWSNVLRRALKLSILANFGC